MTTFSKIWAVLSPGQRAAAVVQAILMVIGMLLEMLGLGLVLPALALLSGGNSLAASPFLARVTAWLGHPTTEQFVVGGLLTLLAVYVVKSAFLAFVAWRQASFVTSLQAAVSQRLFALYMHQPWTFHLQRNSAALSRNMTADMTQFTSVITAILNLVTDGLLGIGIAVILLVVEPVGAIGVAVALAVSTWVFQRIMQRRILAWGIARRDHEKLRMKHLLQGLNGVKDVKILGRERAFLAEYGRHNQATARVNARIQTANQLPRLWYEMLAVAGLALLGSVLVWQGNTGNALISRLGLFAVAAFRVLPSANRVLLTWQTARYAKPVIDSIYAELGTPTSEADDPRQPALSFRDAILVDDVHFQYPGATEPTLRGITARIPRGQSLGIIGGSGAGKSTLVDVILGLLPAERGAIRVDGLDVSSCLRAWQNAIGYVPQAIYLTDDTLRSNVAFGVPEHRIDDAAVARALVAAQLDAFVATLPEGANTIIGERGVRLSGGQRQRLGIARALYIDPPVLVLDEATSSLDVETEKGVMDAINSLHGQKTMIIVAHRLSTVEHCDELIRLDHGRVVKSGAFADVVGGG